MADRPGDVSAVLTVVRGVTLGVLGSALLVGCSTSSPAALPPTVEPTAASETPTGLLPSDDDSSRVGELAPGFPTDLLPVPAGATILVSSAQPSTGSLWAVSLNVRTTQDTAGLIAAVRAPLLAAGFTEQPAATAATGLAAQTSFVRGDGELITVGVRDDGTTRTLAAGGTVARTTG